MLLTMEDIEEDMCMYLNDNAVCYSEQGYHRLVTKEEAYEILRRAEDNGLVHEINQTPGFEDATAICNCWPVRRKSGRKRI